jgi:tripartite-type tricarboxylate transporter receptor subunit TctC
MLLPDYVFPRAEEVAAPARKPITIIVPTAAGGGNDTMARIIAGKMGRLLGQEVLVDNRAGANGAIASEFVARAEPDGHTLMLRYVGTHAMNPALQKLGYDPVKDFEPIGLVGSSPTLMVVHPSVSAPRVQDLVSELKAKPGSLVYASAGDGTPPHFTAALFQLGSGTDMGSVKFDGAAPAIADVVSGRTQVMFPSLFTAHPFIRSGQLRAMGVAGFRRLQGLPELPTLAEAGIEGVDVTQWYGLFAPAHTPAATLARLNQALNEALADAAVVAQFENHGARVEPGTPDALRTKVDNDLRQWRTLVAQGALGATEARPLAFLD